LFSLHHWIFVSFPDSDVDIARVGLGCCLGLIAPLHAEAVAFVGYFVFFLLSPQIEREAVHRLNGNFLDWRGDFGRIHP